MVANGAMTEVPSSLTYYYFVSRGSVHVAFVVSGINDLDIMACDVVTEYFNVPCRENIWLAEGPEHGPEKTGKVMFMVRALYGLNISGAAWRKMFAETLFDMDFVPTVADPDVYCRQVRNHNGEYYYELLLVHVNDLICCLHHP